MDHDIQNLIDLNRYPLHRAGEDNFETLVRECRSQLAKNGLFNLPNFLQPGVSDDIADALAARWQSEAFHHKRSHNIYFKPKIEGLAPDHPALALRETSNRTLCADQVADTDLRLIYEWPEFAQFLARVLDLPELHPMADPLARINVMAYGEGEALNWHFDRSEFTTTLLLQAPEQGGDFEYAKDLRSESDPNYAGVAALLEGRTQPRRMALDAGTLNVFRGKNTAHRVSPVVGDTSRIIAVFSYFDRPEVTLSDSERRGFYGRS